MKHLIHTSKSIAIISFIIGTILLSLKLYNPYSIILTFIGAIFILIATIVNLILFFALLFKLIFSYFFSVLNNKEITNFAVAIGIVLSNIPIVFLYLYILIEFL